MSFKKTLFSSKKERIKKTTKNGFQTIKNKQELEKFLKHLIYSRMIYFSGMTKKSKLGEIISKSNMKHSAEEKAEKFLTLIEEVL